MIRGSIVRRKTSALIAALAGVLFVLALSTPGQAAVGTPGLLDPSVLVVHNGDLTVTQDGAVIENLEIRGTLRIRANNVTVRNVWVYTTSFWTVFVEAGSATFEYMEIGHPAHVGERGIGGSNIVGRYLDIHHVEDGIKLSQNVLYENVRVHDLDSNSPDPHPDAVQDDGGSQNAIVRDSHLDATGPVHDANSAVIIKSDLAFSQNITFSNNYLNGGAYLVFVRDGGHGMPVNVNFTNNRIGPDRVFGLLSSDGLVGWTGNVFADTGEPAIPVNPGIGTAWGQEGVGLVDPLSGMWHLIDTLGHTASFFYGNPGDVPFAGDWDCDGIDTPGLFRLSDAFAYLRNSNSQGNADIRFFFGNPSDIPLAGDFDGDGCDTLSLYRPSEQRFYIINELGANEGGLGPAEFSFLFGNPGDKPFVGDFDGDGIDEVGLHRESTGFVYYRNTLDTGVADNEFFFGDPGDRFVAGDWGIVDGADTPGLFRPGNNIFYFRHSNTQGNADSQFAFGQGHWLPVAGTFSLD
jgi:hypothetical protein